MARPQKSAAKLPQSFSASEDKQFIMSLAKGLELLRAFEPERGPLSNSELARICDLPRPTVARITHTLVKLGYLEFLLRDEKYRLGAGVLALGHSYLGTQFARSIAAPLLAELTLRHDLTAALAVRDRLDMVYIEVSYGRSLRAIRLDVGSRVPIDRSAIGLAYIAGLQPNGRASLLRELELVEKGNWKETLARIENACDEVAAQGFCHSRGLWDTNIAAAGAPLLGLPDSPTMAINVAAPRFGIHANGVDVEVCQDLLAVARTISESLVRRGVIS